MCLYIVNYIDFCGSVLLDLGKIKTYLIGYSNLYASSDSTAKRSKTGISVTEQRCHETQ